MVGAGGVDAVFITDHLPELPGKSNEALTGLDPAYDVPPYSFIPHTRSIPGPAFLYLPATPFPLMPAPPGKPQISLPRV